MNCRWATGPAAVIRAETTTTTPRTSCCCPSGMTTTMSWVTKGEPAGEKWAHVWRIAQNEGNVNRRKGIKQPSVCLLLFRCHHHSPGGLTGLPAACSDGPAPPLAPLPGHDYDQSLLPRHIEPEQNSGLPQQLGPIQSSCQTKSSRLSQISTLRSGSGSVWQCRGQEDSLLGVEVSAADESNTRSINSAKELSIRIISVWQKETISD